MSSSDMKSVNLDDLPKEELIARIHKLEANVFQLRSIIKKRNLAAGGDTDFTVDLSEVSRVKPAKVPKSREFDFSRFSKRHIALKFFYLGWGYQGYVVQEDTTETIEDHLFRALIKAKLIQDRSTSNYHRCGRTDKGVSAFSQVISIDVRSKLKRGLGVIPAQKTMNGDLLQELTSETEPDVEEIDYCGILNKILPEEIRCLSWAPVRCDFSARFDCKSRCYYYYFPASSLNIDKMKEAAQFLVGTHDFTNFCKKDTSKTVINNIRTIQQVKISPFDLTSSSTNPFSIFITTISATGFLWHQIRCIMAILFLVGEGKEEPNLVARLLDVQSVPSKPQYMLASELPLILFSTEWDPSDIGAWNYSKPAIKELTKHLQSLWTRQAIKCSMVQSMLTSVTDNFPIQEKGSQIKCQHDVLINENSVKSYKPILERPTCGNIGIPGSFNEEHC